jgi:hypothetical protein
MSRDGSSEEPCYAKLKQNDPAATSMFMITVDEGWRTWILCTDMYEWSADQLLDILNTSYHKWEHP